MKIGVVIQGPIISQGFDSTSTIKRNIKEYLHKSSVTHIVVSIWKGERFAYSDPKVTVLYNDPPTGRDINNRRRQWFSTLQGTLYLKKHTLSTHVLKIRTDQYVPPSTIDYMKTFYSRKNVKAYVDDPDWKSAIFHEPLLFASAYRTYPFFILDFYFAGNIDDMERLMKSNVVFGEHIFQIPPELDLILKHLYIHDEDFLLTRLERYSNLRALIKAKSDHKIWQYWYAVHRLYLGCFPKHVFSKVIWRGMKWTDFHDQRLGEVRAQKIVDTYFDFSPQWLLLYKDPSEYAQLPRDTSMPQYFTKRESVYALRAILESFALKL